MNNHEYLSIEYDIISASIKESLSQTHNANMFYKFTKDMYVLDFTGLRNNIASVLNKTKYFMKPTQFEIINKKYNTLLTNSNNILAKFTNEIIDPIDLFYTHMKQVSEEDLMSFQKVLI